MSTRQESNIPWYKRVDKITFWAALIVILLFFIWALIAGENMGTVMSTLLTFLTHKFGWLYLILCFLFVLFAAWLALGRYGDIKLGKEDDEPEYSYFSWFAMLFACGYGIGIVFWGAAEPLSFFHSPPFHLAAESAEAAEISLTYAFFHWGWTPWAVYLVMTVPIAYFVHRKGLEPRFSSALEPILGDHINGVVGKLINSALIIGLVGGIATSIGLGILQVSSGLTEVFGITASKFTYLIIGIVWVAIFTTSAVTGINKGIKKLSNINIPLALGIMVFVLLAGPTLFSLNLGTNALGQYLTNFCKMSFWTDPVQQGGFPQGWTIFYWAWWIACAPIVGLFVANISKGRTIKELVGVLMISAPVATWIWFMTFGGSAIYYQMETSQNLIGAMTEKGTESVIYLLIDNLPLAGVLSLAFILLIIIFMATSADSASYIMAQTTTASEHNPDIPPKIIRAIWAVTIGVLAMILVIFGKGITGLQLSSIVASFFVIFVMIGMIVSLMKALKEEEVTEVNKVNKNSTVNTGEEINM